MIKYFEGTVFNTEATAIVNTVNCTGIMGAGIALEYRLRYPDMYNDYVGKCKNQLIKTGKVDYYKASDEFVIVNFPTKWHFKYPSKIEWIDQGLADFVQTYKAHGISSVALPKLGTSNGGLNWHDVKIIMEKHLSTIDIDVYICLDQNKEAEGTEKVMLEKFNSTSIEQLSQKVKLSAKQKQNLQKRSPYRRFWEISDTDSIGIKTYSQIFQYFYKDDISSDSMVRQLSLFDL